MLTQEEKQILIDLLPVGTQYWIGLENGQHEEGYPDRVYSTDALNDTFVAQYKDTVLYDLPLYTFDPNTQYNWLPFEQMKNRIVKNWYLFIEIKKEAKPGCSNHHKYTFVYFEVVDGQIKRTLQGNPLWNPAPAHIDLDWNNYKHSEGYEQYACLRKLEKSELEVILSLLKPGTEFKAGFEIRRVADTNGDEPIRYFSELASTENLNKFGEQWYEQEDCTKIGDEFTFWESSLNTEELLWNFLPIMQIKHQYLTNPVFMGMYPIIRIIEHQGHNTQFEWDNYIERYLHIDKSSQLITGYSLFRN